MKPEFDVWGPVAVPGARPKAKLVPPTPNGNHPLMDWGTFPHRDEENGDHQIATWAAGQISAMPKGQPYFLAVGFSLPHVPCYAPPKWFDLFPPGELEMAPILEADREDTPEFSWYLHWSLPEPRLSWLRENNQLSSLTRSYLASVAFVDHQIGRVLRAVEESAEADNTLIVLWSDHGFHLGEKGISGKNSLWEPSTRVPLFFAGPGVRAGETCVQPVELLDIFPTLVELCGLPKKDDIEGLSLKSQLQQPETCRKRPAITACNPGNHSVRDVRWRYIVYADGSREMYDLSIDPNEYFNRANLPESKMQMEAMHSLIPSNVAPHASGSKHRILHKAGGLWLWEGKPIVRDELQR